MDKNTSEVVINRSGLSGSFWLPQSIQLNIDRLFE